MCSSRRAEFDVGDGRTGRDRTVGNEWRCAQGGVQGGTQTQGGAEPGGGLGGFMEEGLAERRTGAGARECGVSV